MALADEVAQAPRGQLGVMLHDAVAELCGTGMSRVEAFASVSEQTGRTTGAVSEAFYRVERKRNGGTRSRGRARGGATPRRRRGGSDVEGALAVLEQSIGELGKVLRARQREIERLRAQAGVVAEIKRALGPPAANGRRRPRTG